MENVHFLNVLPYTHTIKNLYFRYLLLCRSVRSENHKHRESLAKMNNYRLRKAGVWLASNLACCN